MCSQFSCNAHSVYASMNFVIFIRDIVDILAIYSFPCIADWLTLYI
jgi:hypothetical protein